MCLLKSKREEKKARETILKYDDLSLDQIVKIQGTQYDRKRKLTDKQLDEIKNKLEKGFSIEALSKQYNVSEWVIKYNTNPAFREHQLQLREKKSKAHMNLLDFENRVEYKRSLVEKKKIKVKGLI